MQINTALQPQLISKALKSTHSPINIYQTSSPHAWMTTNICPRINSPPHKQVFISLRQEKPNCVGTRIKQDEQQIKLATMFLVQPIMIITIYSEQLIIQIVCPIGQFITELNIVWACKY